MEINVPKKYRQDIENVIHLLKNEGCESVFLFGSLVTGKVRDDSDIDIGIKGLPREKFLNLFGQLHFDYENKIDLVDFDSDPDFIKCLIGLERLFKLDELIKIKIEHEISRIDKQIDDVIPLLNVCKIKEQPDIIGFGDSHLF